MALPVLSKTWQYNTNISITQGNSSPQGYCSQLLFELKEALIGFGSNPWVVVASSNASVANSNDNWAAWTDVRHENPGTAHSWIVLKQAGVATNFQICFDPIRNSGGNLSVVRTYVSENAGFTGGTTTNRPTATDEIDTWNHPSTGQPEWTDRILPSSVPGWLHVMQSTDGEITRFLYYSASVNYVFGNIEKPKDVQSGWTIPWIFTFSTSEYSGTDYKPTYGYLNDLCELTPCRAGGVTSAHCYYTAEGCISSTLAEQQSFTAPLDSSSYGMYPIGLWCLDVGAQGRLGALTDIWWASVATSDGDYYPADLSKQFVQVYDLVLPWNGGTMNRA